MGTATPEMDERPDAGESDGKVLQPDCVRLEPVAEDVGEAGNELVLDGGRAYQADVIGPGRGVDEVGDCGGGGEGDDESGEKLVGAGEDDPETENGGEG